MQVEVLEVLLILELKAQVDSVAAARQVEMELLMEQQLLELPILAVAEEALVETVVSLGHLVDQE
jgi:hypothetical protein